MPRIDDAAEVRALAYQIWEQEGCPTGREHEHWAQANRIYAQLHPADPKPEDLPSGMKVVSAGRSEIDRLRQALWTPEPFSPELYPNEVPEPRPIWRRHAVSGEAFRRAPQADKPALRAGGARL
ncbi:DUF2934 domain-containing protein [Jiella avicenniae]|uniref:DUF2934 domain-containing protein n=1 Tax=Jiella avicenniae TaxID=2907202 RepID=A0A9X1P2J5_9HYPH|nr:DUF2934 domain-containing protein [Jiella avicenniae]MCE7028173.1 DUF2934 domain-containing protein [Jiella avicenniae]